MATVEASAEVRAELNRLAVSAIFGTRDGSTAGWSVMLRFGEPGLASEGAAWLRASAAVLLRGAFSEVEGHQILDVGIWRAQR